MTVYKRKSTQPLKWLVGLVIFILAMTITFADVYGTETIGAGGATNTATASDTDTPAQCPPKPVPEPTTLILLGGGLSAMYLARRRRNKIDK